MGTAVLFDKVERQTQVACRQFLGVDEKEREADVYPNTCPCPLLQSVKKISDLMPPALILF